MISSSVMGMSGGGSKRSTGALLMGLLGCVALVGALAAKNHASDVFTLKIWKLTIPMDDDGDLIADTVFQPTLQYFEDPDYFHLSSTGDSIVFRAPCGGVTTPNSSYPRTELREMELGGVEPASWGTDDGKVHNLTMTAAINAIPKAKPHVVCAQIHDGKNDVLMVRLEREKLLIERNELEPVVLTTNYELGTFFDIMIIADHGRIRAFFEGTQIMVWPYEGEGLYFKAGCYVQSNPQRGDDPESYGEVEIQKLYVTHKPAK